MNLAEHLAAKDPQKLALIRATKEAFGAAGGKMVLAFLKHKTRPGRLDFTRPLDATKSLVNDARRDLVIELEEMVDLDLGKEVANG